VYSALADAVLVLHFGFILFVALGGLLVLRWRRVAWIHIPCAIWGVAIEFGGWICPLTPLENRLRDLAGETTYQGDFIARHLTPVIYPEGMPREVQVALGLAALVVNLAVYGFVWSRARPRGGRNRPSS
jgi:hypothetical protein